MTAGDGVVPVIVLGEQHLVEGFALAGAQVVVAEGDELAEAWEHLPDDAVVILTAAADRVLGDRAHDAHRTRLSVVMPT